MFTLSLQSRRLLSSRRYVVMYRGVTVSYLHDYLLRAEVRDNSQLPTNCFQDSCVSMTKLVMSLYENRSNIKLWY